MKIIAGILGISIFFFIMNALSLSVEGKNLLESIYDFFKDIYYFFKNKMWED